VTGVDLRQQPGEHRKLLRVAAHIAHRLDEALARVGGHVVRADVVGHAGGVRVHRRVDDRARSSASSLATRSSR
jgi:hypothetical protein